MDNNRSKLPPDNDAKDRKDEERVIHTYASQPCRRSPFTAAAAAAATDAAAAHGCRTEPGQDLLVASCCDWRSIEH